MPVMLRPPDRERSMVHRVYPMQTTPQTQDSPPAATRLWSLDFVLDLLISHCLFASYTAMFTVIPPYVQDRGGSEWELGIVVGSFGVVGILVRPFGGRWIYTLGAKRIAIAGSLIFAVATLLHIPAFNVWLIIPARVLQGVGMALCPVATATIVANLAPGHRRAEAMSYMSNSISAASLYSPVVAFWILDGFGYPSAFIYAAAIGLAGTFAALGLSTARTNIPPTPGSSGKIPLISRGALFPTAVFLTYTVTTAPINTFLPLLAEERGLGNPGLYFTMYSLTSMIALAFSGHASDRLGRGAVIVPGLLLVALGMFVVSTAQVQTLFLAAGVLTGVGFGLIQPATQSLTVERVPVRERGAALATLQQAWDIGGSGGAFAVGPLGTITGVAATFAIAGAGTVAGAVGYVVGSVRTRTEPPTAA